LVDQLQQAEAEELVEVSRPCVGKQNDLGVLPFGQGLQKCFGLVGVGAGRREGRDEGFAEPACYLVEKARRKQGAGQGFRFRRGLGGLWCPPGGGIIVFGSLWVN
jgi:hypothetical protein